MITFRAPAWFLFRLRAPFDSLPTMLRSFHRFFITPVEENHPELEGLAGWDTLFSAVLEIIGEKEGAALLRVVLETGDDRRSGNGREPRGVPGIGRPARVPAPASLFSPPSATAVGMA